MSDQPKVQMNFHAPVTGAAGNVEGDMIVHAANSAQTDAANQLRTLLDQLRQKDPNANDEQIFEILLQDFQTMPQKNPQNWQRWQDVLSIIFTGGVEATKLLIPMAGIPIEVLKRLYEIYQRNRQHPSR